MVMMTMYLPIDLRNAAATKKLAIFDAFEILNRIQEEQEAMLDGKVSEDTKRRG